MSDVFLDMRAVAPVFFGRNRVALYAKSDGLVYFKTRNGVEVLAGGGVGIPAGGSSGQVLKKSSATDYDVSWSDDLTEGGGGGVAWGGITGTLANQSDLNTALNGKAASSHTHAQADVTNLTSDLAAKAAATDSRFWSIVMKSSDQAKTSDTTLANDSALTLSLNANTKYFVKLRVYWTTADTPDIKFRITGPASPSFLFRTGIQYQQGGSPSFDILRSAYDAGDLVVLGSGTNGGGWYEDIVIHNGSNAGTFAFQWAQNTSSASATTVRAGSHLQYRVI